MRLLLIEDEHDLARILKNSLEKAGFAFDVACIVMNSQANCNESPL